MTNKKLCSPRFEILTALLRESMADFPEYALGFQAIAMDSARHNLEACADEYCAACISGENPHLFNMLMAYAAVNDGEAPAESVAGLDLYPEVLPELFAEVLRDPESRRAKALATLLDARQIDRAFDCLNAARDVLIAEAVALKDRGKG